MPSSHLILCRLLLLLPSIFSSIRVFTNESVLHIRWPKYWSFSFNISHSNEHSGLISFRMDLPHHFMVHRWGKSGNSGNSDFILWGSKIAADGDCSHEIKRCLLLGRKVMTNLDSILKCRDITLSTNIHLVKAMVFSVVMYGCQSWTIKKAECQEIDAFELQ